jgi:hypothetical protein
MTQLIDVPPRHRAPFLSNQLKAAPNVLHMGRRAARLLKLLKKPALPSMLAATYNCWPPRRFPIRSTTHIRTEEWRIHMNRYSAMLLFQFRVLLGGKAGKRRTCEKRIVSINARSARSALAQAKRKGKRAEFSYTNSEGNPVHFEFVGVTDLLELGVECEPDEVWYDMCELFLPMERREQLIPPESELSAMRGRGKVYRHNMKAS